MDLQNLFVTANSDKFVAKSVLLFPPHLKYVVASALPRET